MRAVIPEPLKPHRVDLYLLTGTSAAGPTFADPVSKVHCLVEDKLRLIRQPTGDAIQSTRAIYLDQVEIPLGSQVDYLGDRRTVVSIAQGRHGSRLAHTVLYLG